MAEAIIKAEPKAPAIPNPSPVPVAAGVLFTALAMLGLMLFATLDLFVGTLLHFTMPDVPTPEIVAGPAWIIILGCSVLCAVAAVHSFRRHLRNLHPID